LTETWMKHDNVTDQMLSIDDRYDVYRADRPHKVGGGVCLLVSKRINSTLASMPRDIKEVPNCEILCVDLHTDIGYRLVLCYRPPGYVSSQETTLLFSNIGSYCNQTEHVGVVLGDFNMPAVNWITFDGLGPECSEYLAEANIRQIVDFPTMVSSTAPNTNDLIFVSDTQFVLSVRPGPPFGNSIHISICFELHDNITRNVGGDSSDGAMGKSVNYIKGDYKKINEILLVQKWDDVYACEDLNECYNNFCLTLMNIVSRFCPLRPAKRNCRRVNSLPKGMKSRYKKKNIMFKKIRTPSDRVRYRLFAKDCDRMVQDHYYRVESKAVESKDKFYSYIKSKTKQRSDIVSMTTNEGIQTLDKKEIAEMFAEHFASVYVEPTDGEGAIGVDGSCCNQSNAKNSFDITEELVLRELHRLPDKETRSEDGVPPVVLKRCANSLIGPILHLLRKSVSSGKIPDKWRHILVRPTHKKGSKKLVKNFRPIGLTCILSKVCERIVRDQMVKHLTSQGMISDRQHGFRSRRSTITSLLSTHNDWKKLLLTASELYAVYLDFSKAFDVVSHDILKSKLSKAGFGGMAICWLIDYLSRRTMSVIVEDKESSKKVVHSGVIQGSAIGPALFSFLAYDIPDHIGNLAMSGLFADDIKVYDEKLTNVEQASQKVVDWSKSNKLPLAPDKSVLIKIRRRRTVNCPEHITIDGSVIHSSNIVCDLGVNISDDLECESHVNIVMKKAFRISNLILRILKTKKIDLFKKAFYSMVLPILEYGSVVWCPLYSKDVNKIEAVQRRFTKRAQYRCGMKKECYVDRLSRWKIQTLEVRRLYIDLVWVYKIIYGHVDIDRNSFFRINQTDNEIKLYPLPIPSCMMNNTQVNTLAQRTYRIWNNLPLNVRNSPSILSFKYKIKMYGLDKQIISKINM
jgi:hypothetical protein